MVPNFFKEVWLNTFLQPDWVLRSGTLGCPREVRCRSQGWGLEGGIRVGAGSTAWGRRPLKWVSKELLWLGSLQSAAVCPKKKC